MELFDINPYVRYARKQTRKIQSRLIKASDHRIIYCDSGNFSISVAEKTYDLSKGSLIFFPAGIPYKSLSDNSEQTIYACNFDLIYSPHRTKSPIPPTAENLFSQDMLTEPELCRNELPFPDVIFIPHIHAKAQFEAIINEYSDRKLYHEEKCGALLKVLLADIIRISKTDRVSFKSDAHEILEYVHKHYSENITNAELGKEFSYHPNYISSLIKRHTGTTLHKYIINYRIHRAMEILQNGECNVTETARMVGFEDVKHFSKCFKSVTGNTPTSYLLKKEFF